MFTHRFVAIIGLIVFALIAGSARSAWATAASFDPATGKWYDPVLVPQGITWGDAAADAVAQGGYLASPTTPAENDFVFALIDNPSYWTGLSVNADRLGPWLGASADNDFNGSDATWTWASGAPFSYAPWGPNQPDGYPGDLPMQAVDYYSFSSIGATWGDTPQNGVAGFTLPQGYVVEFNKDPNGTSAVPLPPAIWSGLGLLMVLAIVSRIKSFRALAI